MLKYMLEYIYIYSTKIYKYILFSMYILYIDLSVYLHIYSVSLLLGLRTDTKLLPNIKLNPIMTSRDFGYQPNVKKPHLELDK
jgi:hypothetical protein